MRKQLPFIRFYVDDYMGDTGHLRTIEHGAYDLILWVYWRRQKALPESQLQRISKTSSEEWAEMRDTLADFFDIDVSGVWHHKRIELELERVRNDVKRKRKAGKASGKARRKKAENELNRTDVQQALNTRSTNAEQSIRSNEFSAKTVPIARQRLTKTENELMEARAAVWKLEKQLQDTQAELDQTGEIGGES